MLKKYTKRRNYWGRLYPTIKINSYIYIVDNGVVTDVRPKITKRKVIAKLSSGVKIRSYKDIHHGPFLYGPDMLRHTIFTSQALAKAYLTVAMERYKGHIAKRIERFQMLIEQNQVAIRELELEIGSLK